MKFNILCYVLTYYRHVQCNMAENPCRYRMKVVLVYRPIPCNYIGRDCPGFYIYDRPLNEINMIAIRLCVEFADKILTFAVLKRWPFQQKEMETVFK